MYLQCILLWMSVQINKRSHKTGQLRKALKEEKFQNGEIFQTMYTKLKEFHTGKVNLGIQLF